MKRFTFPKPEHLCLKGDVERLFSAGSHAMTAWPLRAVFRKVEHGQGPAAKVLLSVPKRRLHHATDRNKAKRQLREAYRRHKHELLQALPAGSGLHIAFIWLSARPEPSDTVEQRIVLLLQRMAERISAAECLKADTERPRTEADSLKADTERP